MGRNNKQMFYLSKIYKLSKERCLRGESLSARFCLSLPPPPLCLSCVSQGAARWPNVSELQDRKEGLSVILCIIAFWNEG